jgi:hypothetical protein
VLENVTTLHQRHCRVLHEFDIRPRHALHVRHETRQKKPERKQEKKKREKKKGKCKTVNKK